MLGFTRRLIPTVPLETSTLITEILLVMVSVAPLVHMLHIFLLIWTQLTYNCINIKLNLFYKFHINFKRKGIRVYELKWLI